MLSVKATFLGDHGVGKTCLIYKFAFGMALKHHIPTVADNASSNHMVDGKPLSCFWNDTCGNTDHDRIRPQSFNLTDVFVLCYDLTNRESFENIKG